MKIKGLQIYTIIVLSFLYAPIVALLVYSFNPQRHLTNFSGFSLRWYELVFQNENLIGAMKNSLFIALLSGILATILALMLAYKIYQSKSPKLKKFQEFFKIMTIIPDISMAIGLTFIFQFLKLSLGIHTVLISHISFCLAFAFLIIFPGLTKLDTNLQDAAVDLGASKIQVLKYIILPELFPTLLASFLICFTLSWDDFIFSFFSSDAESKTLPVQIYAMIKRGVNPQINAIGTISLLFSSTLVYLSLRLRKINKTII